MGILEIILISIGLAMDAFAVAICKGMAMKTNDDESHTQKKTKKAIIIALYFGVFQALMPALGYLLGSTFKNVVESIDHWIAFALLGLIGANMIRESFAKESETSNDSIAFKVMIVLAIATSIDALAVGVSFAFLSVNLLSVIASIGVITFALSFIGVLIGNKVGNRFGNKAELIGGIILILLGTKILLEHLGVIAF